MAKDNKPDYNSIYQGHVGKVTKTLSAHYARHGNAEMSMQAHMKDEGKVDFAKITNGKKAFDILTDAALHYKKGLGTIGDITDSAVKQRVRGEVVSTFERYGLSEEYIVKQFQSGQGMKMLKQVQQMYERQDTDNIRKGIYHEIVEPNNYVTNFVWHKTNKGKIKFKQELNISGISNLDSLIKSDTNFFSVYSTTEPRLDKQANITFENVNCNLCTADKIIYATGEYSSLAEIQANGESCSAVGKCSNFVTVGSGSNCNCTFDVSGFTGYAFGGNANLTINDSAEGSSVNTNTSINFFVYYVNSTSGAHLSSASCNVSFDDNPSTWYAMTEDVNRYNYTKSSGFSTAATHVWNVTCAKTGFTSLVANDTVVVTSAGGGAVPEFEDYALLLILITVVSGFFIVRKKENS